MTNKLVLRVAALSVALSALCLLSLTAVQAQPGTAATAAGGPRISFSQGIDASLLKRAADLRVYKLQPPKLTRGAFDGLVGRLLPAVQRGEVVTAGNVIARSDAANFIMLDTKSGLFSMSRGMANQIDDKPGKLPDDAQATDVALAFLKQNELGPRNGKEMVLARVGHIRSQSFDPKSGAKGPIRDQMVTVNFSRLVDGTEVVGDASKMIVQIGDGGEVVGAGINWRELGDAKPVGAKGLRTAEQLQQDIQAFISREMNMASAVDVKQVGLFYYDNGGEFLQPVIGYEALVREGRQTLRYFGQTALLRTPAEQVGPDAVTPRMRETVKLSPRELKPPTAKGD